VAWILRRRNWLFKKGKTVGQVEMQGVWSSMFDTYASRRDKPSPTKKGEAEVVPGGYVGGVK